jgi:hypothetical protein
MYLIGYTKNSFADRKVSGDSVVRSSSSSVK